MSTPDKKIVCKWHLKIRHRRLTSRNTWLSSQAPDPNTLDENSYGNHNSPSDKSPPVSYYKHHRIYSHHNTIYYLWPLNLSAGHAATSYLPCLHTTYAQIYHSQYRNSEARAVPWDSLTNFQDILHKRRLDQPVMEFAKRENVIIWLTPFQRAWAVYKLYNLNNL